VDGQLQLRTSRLLIVLAATAAAALTGCTVPWLHATHSPPAEPTYQAGPPPSHQMNSFCKVGSANRYSHRFWPATTTPTGYAPDGYTHVVRVRIKDTSGRAVQLSQFGLKIINRKAIIDSGVIGQHAAPWIGSKLPERLRRGQSSVFIVKLPLKDARTHLTASQYRQSQCFASPD
jgi:hypothetical protein